MVTMSMNELPAHALVERLFGLTTRPAEERVVCISARCAHGVKSVDIDRPVLAVVLCGQKQVHSGTRSRDLGPGDLLAMAPGARLDVVNRPDPVVGRYLTLSIPLCDQVLAAARQLCAQPVPPSGLGFTTLPISALQSEWEAFAEAVEQDDETQARLAVLRILMRLAHTGFGDLLLPASPTLSARVRGIVTQAPARRWRSADFEDALAISGATLRRRLASEGPASLRDLIAQARLACALEMLYTTRSPVKTVAHRVGYRSVESFARRFRDRYGLDASSIGNAPEETHLSI